MARCVRSAASNAAVGGRGRGIDRASLLSMRAQCVLWPGKRKAFGLEFFKFVDFCWIVVVDAVDCHRATVMSLNEWVCMQKSRSNAVKCCRGKCSKAIALLGKWCV